MASRRAGELLRRPTVVCSVFCRPAHIIPPSTSWSRAIVTSKPAQSAQPQPKQDETPQNDISSTLDSFFKAPTRAAPGLERTPTSYGRARGEMNQGERVFGERFSPRSAGFANTRRTSLRVDALDMPATQGTADGLSAMPFDEPVREERYPRLSPSTGRTVVLDSSKGRDIVRGVNMLGSLIGRNGVRRDFNRQKFHERPGLRRKRLKSERWRARFKEGFSTVTSRVRELTKKGW